ncbi:hypothetical protein DNHGIG_19660 [Collibacillus ludicampi]|uniref:Uncharacterized protein n=1 Tax=Collibacillus ludicampi TaxID=2771369 RepID=A0AAV4LF17_9BACL|nr:hypothetical protein [Collibacillus ludicampi]GIM46417.1 hypothetical protein DNHGIG_19660 [Collibacillus ludicampi]
MFLLPFLFIATGLVSFALFNITTLLQFAGWITHQPRSPAGWFHVHLLVLGWATMIAMGAVYQLIRVVLQKDVFSRTLGYVHYVLYTVGTAGLLVGFAAGQAQWIAIFATLAWIGIVLFVVNITLTLIQAAEWNLITLSTSCALLFLFLTGLIGLLMGLNFAFQWWPAWHERLFYTHIWMGTIGWFGLLITGFSYKMLPMFYLSHGVSNRTSYVVLFLWNAAVFTGAVAFLTAAPIPAVRAAVGLLTLAVYAYNMHITRIRNARHKKSPGAGVLAAVYSARALAVISTVALACTLFAPERVMDERAIVIIVWAYLWGWVALTILGYLSKIVPFLWWTHKYGPHVGKGNIPTMADLLKDRCVAYGLAAIAASLVVQIVSLGLNNMVWTQWSGVALSLFSLFYVCMIAKVFTR